MYEYYFTFRSMTRAQLAVQQLNAQKMDAQLVRIPKAAASMGCGYAVRIHCDDIYPATSSLRSAGIGFERVFGLDYHGEAKEVFM